MENCSRAYINLQQKVMCKKKLQKNIINYNLGMKWSNNAVNFKTNTKRDKRTYVCKISSSKFLHAMTEWICISRAKRRFGEKTEFYYPRKKSFTHFNVITSRTLSHNGYKPMQRDTTSCVSSKCAASPLLHERTDYGGPTTGATQTDPQRMEFCIRVGW